MEGKRRYRLPKLRLSEFVKDEDGFMEKGNILKYGSASIVALFTLSAIQKPAHGLHVNRKTDHVNALQIPQGASSGNVSHYSKKLHVDQNITCNCY